MRIERGDHAADRFRQQLFIFHRLDVVGLDQAIHVGQLAQLVERQGRAGLLRMGRQLERCRHADQDAHADQPEMLCFHAHVDPCCT